jgi:hypothetical protein
MARRSGVVSNAQATPPNFSCAGEDFWLLQRQITTVTSGHAVHYSTSPRSGVNFRHDVSSRRATSEFPNSLPVPPGKWVAGKTTTNDEEKGILALVKAGEPGPEHFADGCRQQTEEAEKRECRYSSGRTSRDSHTACAARGQRKSDAAHDWCKGSCDSGAGRWSWAGLG